MQKSANPSEKQATDWQILLKKIILIGYTCLCISSVCLYFSYSKSNPSEDYGTASALLMMGARTAGLGAFFIGALAIFNRRWTHGSLLFLGSMGLPVLSFYFHGYI